MNDNVPGGEVSAGSVSARFAITTSKLTPRRLASLCRLHSSTRSSGRHPTSPLVVVATGRYLGEGFVAVRPDRHQIGTRGGPNDDGSSWSTNATPTGVLDRGLLLELQRPVELERERLGCRALERAEVEHRMGPNGRTLEYRLTTAGRDL